MKDASHAFSLNFLIKSEDERAGLCSRTAKVPSSCCILLLACLFFVVYPGLHSLRGFIETICRPYLTLNNSDTVLQRIFLYSVLMAVTLNLCNVVNLRGSTCLMEDSMALGFLSVIK